MKPEDWDAGFGRSIGMFLNGNGIRGMDTRGQRVVDDSFLLLFNAHDEGMDWVLPPEEFAPAWRLVIDTSGVPDLPETIPGGSKVAVASKGMVVLQALAGTLRGTDIRRTPPRPCRPSPRCRSRCAPNPACDPAAARRAGRRQRRSGGGAGEPRRDPDAVDPEPGPHRPSRRPAQAGSPRRRPKKK